MWEPDGDRRKPVVLGYAPSKTPPPPRERRAEILSSWLVFGPGLVIAAAGGVLLPSIAQREPVRHTVGVILLSMGVVLPTVNLIALFALDHMRIMRALPIKGSYENGTDAPREKT